MSHWFDTSRGTRWQASDHGVPCPGNRARQERYGRPGPTCDGRRPRNVGAADFCPAGARRAADHPPREPDRCPARSVRALAEQSGAGGPLTTSRPSAGKDRAFGVAQAAEHDRGEHQQVAYQRTRAAGDQRKARHGRLARFAEERLEVTPHQLLTASGTQAIDLIGRFLFRPGDTVLVDDSCSFDFQALLRARQVRPVSVPWTPTGPDLAAFEAALVAEQPRLYLTNAALHDPTGGTSCCSLDSGS